MTLRGLELPKRNDTLREQLLETLRYAIISGKISPGGKLVEAHIAEQLGVSRGPVREAIRQLVEEGLVEHISYRGTLVKTLTLEDIEEIYSFRILLESFAFRLVWSKRTPEFFEELEARHQALQETIFKKDKQEAIKQELDLHGVVYEYANHKILMDTWKMLRARIHFYFTVHQTAHQRAGALLNAHDDYVELAKGEQLEPMLREIEEHMQRGLDRVGEFVRYWNDAPRNNRGTLSEVINTKRPD